METRFKDIVKSDTPILVVNFKVNDEGREDYEWGVKGNIPLLPLIGYVVKVLNEYASTDIQRLYLFDKICKPQALVIAYVDKEFHWFLHKDTPKYGMLGMLKMIETTLVGTTMARSTANQQRILGVDGKPIH